MDPDDLDSLLWHFAASLPVDSRDEFDRAARDALHRLDCLGPGVAHRVIAELLPDFAIPIPDAHGGGTKHGPRLHRRSSKLTSAAPVA
jgi:hypothetical protein